MSWRTRTCGAPSCRKVAEQCSRYCEEHKDYDVQREKQQKQKRWWGKWYATAQWSNLRKLVLARDPLCMWPENGGCTKPSTIADHKIPHRGDRSLWADMNNLQGLCAHHHGIKTAREDSFHSPV
jgi:5-methylcytosine-specific restriction protein A